VNGDEASLAPLPSESVFREVLRQGAEQIEVRKRELESQERIRTRELDLQEFNNRQAWDHAGRALNAQAQDLREVRAHEARLMLLRLVAAAVIGLSVMGFMIALLRMGKDQLVGDLIKVIGGFTAGGMALYWFGKARGRAETQREGREADPSVPAV
jgi:hypothetical protein